MFLLRTTQSNKQKWLFCAGFAVLGFVLLQVPLTHLMGSKVTFTLFDAFGPIAGGFLGGAAGAVAVLAMQVFNLVVHGGHVQDIGTVIRLFPMLFATIYFSKKRTFNIIVPLLAILAFVVSPIGRTVWFYSLFWLVPIVCYFFQERSLLARSLGATFTAHAVGGAVWVYLVPLPAAVWVGLIPIVVVERMVFTLGVAVTYLAFNNAFYLLNEKKLFSYQLPVQRQYVWGRTSGSPV